MNTVSPSLPVESKYIYKGKSWFLDENELKVVLTFGLTDVCCLISISNRFNSRYFVTDLCCLISISNRFNSRYFVTYNLFSSFYNLAGVRIHSLSRADAIRVRTECKIGRTGTGTRTWLSGRTLGTIVALQLCLPWQFGLTPFVQWCTFSYLPMKTRGDRVFAHEFAVGGEA